MPNGKPSAQTVASAKYQEKAGYVAKTYKLKREVVDEFDRACTKAGVSKASQITKMMMEFIQEVGQSDTD